VLSWITLIWEIGFPIFVMMPSLRALTLWLGVAFHVGTGVLLPLGPFPLYMLCLYLPLVPWEQLENYAVDRKPQTHTRKEVVVG
jgi:hypothetical protein